MTEIRSSCFSQIMHSLKSKVEKLKLAKASAEEKIRRQRELLQQARREASAAADRHRYQLTAYTKRLNFLQSRPDNLNDEECAQLTRQLCRHLDIWVKKNFSDASILNTMTVDSLHASGLEVVVATGYPQNAHQRRELIQDLITRYVHAVIFSHPIFGVCDDSLEKMLMTVNHEVMNLCKRPLKHSFGHDAN